MNSSTRRTFLKQTGAGIAGAAFVAASASRVLGANERLVVGLIGPGGQGQTLGNTFVGHNVKVAYVCDADSRRREQSKAQCKADHAVADMRKVLDDKAVDAVVIATPDHWHAPATILACEAGKHVYVEKPCAHNIREGRLMIEAARRNNRVVQVGTQSRSTPTVRNAMKRLAEGAIGDVLVAKAWNSQLRANHGHKPACDPPAELDYDMWTGPAPMVPFRPSFHPGHWRWWFNFGCGDAGNDGVHDIDIARWGLGVTTHPSSVTGYGAKIFFDDDQEFPDTQYVQFEYPGDGRIGHQRLLVYEHRIWSPYVQEGHENGNAFYGTKGMMVLGKHAGWKMYGPRNKLIEEESGPISLPAHVGDFIDAVKTGRRPNADIEIGHLSASLSHLANIIARVGRQVKFDPQKEQIVGDDAANALVRRQYREGHWAVPKGV
jgi:predicted dehydrogenase